VYNFYHLYRLVRRRNTWTKQLKQSRKEGKHKDGKILFFISYYVRLSTSQNAHQPLKSFRWILLIMSIVLLICRPLEQVAMDRLVELAYRKLLVCCLSPLQNSNV
jgi:hypothetical protein